MVHSSRGHDEGRVASGAAQVEQTARGQHDDAMAIGEDVAIDLRLDVLDLDARDGLKASHIDLVVEVADVPNNRVVLHLLHVLARDDVEVTGRRHEDVDLPNHLLDGRHLVALHARLERVDRIDLRHQHAGAGPAERSGAALADVSEAEDERALAAKHDLCC